MNSPYIDPPTIPEGMIVNEYRINRQVVRGSALRCVMVLMGLR